MFTWNEYKKNIWMLYLKCRIFSFVIFYLKKNSKIHINIYHASKTRRSRGLSVHRIDCTDVKLSWRSWHWTYRVNSSLFRHFSKCLIFDLRKSENRPSIRGTSTKWISSSVASFGVTSALNYRAADSQKSSALSEFSATACLYRVSSLYWRR